MTDMAKLSSSIQNALKAVGTTNGHSAPASQDPMDAVLHEYYVAKLGEKFFTDRADKAKQLLTKSFSSVTQREIQSIIESTIINEAGESAIILDAQHYSLEFATRKGAKRLDTTALKVALQVKHGMPAAVVDSLIDSCSKTSAPSQIYSVKPVRGE